MLCSCNHKTNNEGLKSILDKAEACLEQFPDSSLHVLNLLKAETITSDECLARYALLKSIALDKNYIDVADDSLTSIAVSYYAKYGTAEEKLKSFLYNGNVFANAKDYDKAMSSYLQAEQYVNKCKDFIIVGRLYSVKSILYNNIFDYQTSIAQARLASEYFLKGGDTTRFLNNLNNIAVIMNNSSLFDLADEYLSKVEQYWHKLTPTQKGVYYSVKLAQIPMEDKDALAATIEKTLSLQQSVGNINWLAISEAYLKIGDCSSSLQAINHHKLTGGITDATYYMILSKISISDSNVKLNYSY